MSVECQQQTPQPTLFDHLFSAGQKRCRRETLCLGGPELMDNSNLEAFIVAGRSFGVIQIGRAKINNRGAKNSLSGADSDHSRIQLAK